MTTIASLYNLFSRIPLVYPLYFFYGAAFLFLGISISAKDLKASELRLANSLWMLGVFGFIHGVHEWFQLYPLIQGEQMSLRDLCLVNLILFFMIVLSFCFLLQFGLAMISALNGKRTLWAKGVPVVLFFVWTVIIMKRGERVDLLFLQQAEIGVRYTLGLAGGLVTAYGLISYSHEIKNLSKSVSRNFFSAGIAFAFYGILEGVSDLRGVLTGVHVPVEFLRGASTVFVSYFIMKALNIFDIETRRKIEQQTRLLVQTEKLSSLGQLAAGISHEINNPLTNASLGIQTLKQRFKSDGVENELVAKLDAVEKNIDRASMIAQELLQFSRQRETEFIPLDINAVINGSLTLLEYKLKNIGLERHLATLPEVMGDRGKLEQVFINIVSNSLEAMSEGGKLTISSFQRNGMVEVRVADTGSGISEENQSRVFDPFFTTKEIGSGTGLGLSICYGIIKQHHGRIDISSAAGRGTIVIVKIPIRERYEEDSDR